MATATLPVLDLSRPRLRQVAHWIRDELDPLVAREGPELLRADDVLTLHDFFQLLKTSPSITALDLRATGIHRAIMEIAGIATRWPGRLADDCDSLIDLWTMKFGRLEDLHPFLYGRGGRLEGIASIDETSKLALLRRWQENCPDRISPKRARRHGTLGFRPGSWWINTLFACHAGIIDIDTIEGGICSDKHGSYAVVIMEGSELHAPTESTLTYRCNNDDRGKFRLTAATPRSREPIRILRSHSVNSMWGPRAGVRYEGLYRVTGWAVHQPKMSSFNVGQKLRLGDMYYDVHLERCDSVPLHEVFKSPTAAELDDYSEYKRLRKIQRDLRNKGLAALNEASQIPSVAMKVAPAIPPPGNPLPKDSSLFKASPAASRSTTAITYALSDNAQEPAANGPVGGHTIINDEETSTVAKQTDLSHPAAMLPFIRTATSHSDSSRIHTPLDPKSTVSVESTSKSQNSITEVAPWVGYDTSRVNLPTTDDHALTAPSGSRIQVVSEHLNRSVSPGARKHQKGSEARHVIVQRSGKTTREPISGSREKQDSKSNTTRSRNPMMRLFDGTEDEAKTATNCFYRSRTRAASDASETSIVAYEHCAHVHSVEGKVGLTASLPINHVSIKSCLDEMQDTATSPCGCAILSISPFGERQGPIPSLNTWEGQPVQNMSSGSNESLLTSLDDSIASRPVATTRNIPTSI